MNIDSVKLAFLIVTAVICFFVVLIKGRGPFISPSSLIILTGLLAIAFHYNFVSYSISDANSWNIMFGGFLWLAVFLVVSAFGPEKSIKSAFRVLSVAVYPATIYLVYLNLSGTGLDSLGRFVAITDNPNIIGAYMALFMFPIALQNILSRSPRLWIRLCNYGVAVAILYLIYSSGARGALIAVGVSISYVIVISKGISLEMKFLIVTTVLIAPFVIQEFFVKYDSGFLSTREYLLILRFEAIAERPWFGWGFGADVNNTFNETNVFPPQEKGNTFLQFIEEFGWVLGLPLFAMLIVHCFSISFRLRTQRNMIWLSVFIFSALVHSMAETWMLNFRSYLAIFFWFLVLMGGAYAWSNKLQSTMRFATPRKSLEAQGMNIRTVSNNAFLSQARRSGAQYQR